VHPRVGVQLVEVAVAVVAAMTAVRFVMPVGLCMNRVRIVTGVRSMLGVRLRRVCFSVGRVRVGGPMRVVSLIVGVPMIVLRG
jgi:hypothetical protein